MSDAAKARSLTTTNHLEQNYFRIALCQPRVAEVGVLAETAKYPSMLATSARLQIFTGTHFCAVLSMVGERAFVNFRKFVN